MNNSSHHLYRHCGLILSSSLLIASLSGCGAATRELEPVGVQEAKTETTVKSALIGEPSVDAASIRVSLVDGAIVLTGFVGSDVESETAERLAREAVVDRTVINSLEVR